jgi:hypothetical protein
MIPPEIIGAGAGYIAGQVAEQAALWSQDHNQKALMYAHSGVAETVNSHPNLLRRAVATLAITGALVGFEVGEAITPANTHILERPTLTEAVDNTLGTGNSLLGGDGNQSRISRIAFKVASNPGLKVQIELAHNSTVESVSPSALMSSSEKGYGSQDMPDAFADALQTTEASGHVASSNALGQSNEVAGGVLVVTDSDSIGTSSAATINEANKAGDQPVFIVNTGPAKNAEALELQAIANATNGKYYNVNKTGSVTELVSQLDRDMTPKPINEKQDPDLPAWMAAALATLAIGGKIFNNRKRQLRANS